VGTNAMHLTASNYTVNEGCTTATITVNRDNPAASGVATVDVATSDGSASQRNRYGMTTARVSFGPGETSKSFSVVINDNNYVDGNGTINLGLANPKGGVLAGPTLATLTIIDDDVVLPTSNINDSAAPFVCQQYHDFLSRDPDAAGAAFWTNKIAACGADTACVNAARTDASKAFFASAEFKDTGFFVYLTNKAAFGTLPLYVPFQNDRSRVVGGANLAQSQLALATVFTQRPEFVNRYPASDGPGFVDAILTTVRNDTGVDLFSQRQALIDLFNTGGRGAVLYRIADDNQTNPINNRAFVDAEYNRAFVYTQYAGYLRRDSDIGGFLFWLDQARMTIRLARPRC